MEYVVTDGKTKARAKILKKELDNEAIEVFKKVKKIVD